jgi:homocysteine S-methyltransferase
LWADVGRREGRLQPIVAASAGPYGAFLADGSEYDGRYGVAASVLDRFHRARLEVLLDTKADVLAFETVPSAAEAKVLAGLLRERSDETKPAWISFSCRDGDRLWDGTPIEEAVRACAGVERLCAVGINCTHPRYVGTLVGRVSSVTDLPVVAYPNSGEAWDAARGLWTGPKASWIDEVEGWVEAGARIVGGCCRVGPDEIRLLRARLEEICLG